MAFQMEWQKQSMWCWAAVAVSVDRYFAGSSSPWTQCRLATEVLAEELNDPDCCADPDGCDVPWYLDKTLKKIDRHRDTRGVLSWEELLGEKQDFLPVCVYIHWNGGSGHFAVISGRISPSGQRLVDVADPWYGPSTLLYSEFVCRYKKMGQWTHSFLVCRKAGG